MLYWNKAKARPWTTNQGLQLPATKQNKSDFKRKILKPDDLVKWKEKNGINFSTQGDEIKAQAQRFIASGQAAQARFWAETSKRISKRINYTRRMGETWLQDRERSARFCRELLNQVVILELGRAGKGLRYQERF